MWPGGTCSSRARSARSGRPSTAPRTPTSGRPGGVPRADRGLLEGGVDLLSSRPSRDLDDLLHRRSRRPRGRCPTCPIVALDDLRRGPGAGRGRHDPRGGRPGARGGRRRCPRRQLRRRPGGLPRCARQMAADARPAPLLIMPNAGPAPRGSRASSSTPPGPAYFADAVPRFLAAGARLIGGCCGTTPEHIAAMRQALDARWRRGAGTRGGRAAPSGRRRPSVPRTIAVAERGRRATGRARRPPASPRPSPTGRFVISVEIDPPRSVRIERTIEAARLLQAAGRRPGQHQRQRHGPRAHGRDGGRVRHPARPGPRVPRPLHDPRPQPDGARIGAARRARAGRPRHPGAHRRPAAHRRLPHRHGHLGHRLDRAHRHPPAAQPRRGPGGQAHRRPGRLHDRLRARPDRGRPGHELDRLDGQARGRAPT